MPICLDNLALAESHPLLTQQTVLHHLKSAITVFSCCLPSTPPFLHSSEPVQRVMAASMRWLFTSLLLACVLLAALEAKGKEAGRPARPQLLLHEHLPLGIATPAGLPLPVYPPVLHPASCCQMCYLARLLLLPPSVVEQRMCSEKRGPGQWPDMFQNVL